MSLCCCLCVRWAGIILTLASTAFQYANAIGEEKKGLLPLFCDSYLDFAKQTRRMLLKARELIAFILLIAISLTGLFIRCLQEPKHKNSHKAAILHADVLGILIMFLEEILNMNNEKCPRNVRRDIACLYER